MEPQIQYATTSDGVNIAYYRIGRGEPLVYLTPGSHLQREWQYPEQRAWLERLASSRTLIRFDHRGTGLSDREPVYSPDVGALDIEAIVEKERLTRFALMGQLYSGITAIVYASDHPEQVTSLLLWRTYARVRDFVAGSPQLQAARAAASIDWATFTEIIALQVTGSGDANQTRRFAAYMREMATGEAYQRSVERYRDLDVTPRLRELTMPVLVIQRREGTFPTVEVARNVAAAIPNARLVLFDGEAVAPFFGDTDALLTTINQFLEEKQPQQSLDGLTPRELEILALLADGKSNEAIAQALVLSTRTVERHITNIYRKIDAHNRAEATAYAFRRGIVRG